MEPATSSPDTAAPPTTETSLGGSSVQIVKGKRTKRQRPQSPIPFRVPSSPAKSDEGSSDICSNIQDPTVAATNTNTNNDDNNNNRLIMVIHDSAMITKHDQQPQHQPSSSSEEYNLYRDSTTTPEQEEDMANCLILLAQGQSRFPPFDHQKSSAIPPVSQHQPIGQKYTSRRFMETGTSSGTAGYYVYECRTCGKTFPSFQALGGHRASHKKPKTAAAAAAAREEEMIMARQRHQQSNFFISDGEGSPRDTISASLSLQLNTNTNRSSFVNGGNHNYSHHHNNSNNTTNKNKPRVHECAICGAEFSSGQALGGHMRRHRGSMGVPGTPSHPSPVANPTALSLIPLSTIDPMGRNDDHYFLRRDVDQNDDQKSLMLMSTTADAPSTSLSPKGNVLLLDLDLNLPAPAEQETLDHHQQQQHERRLDHQCSNSSSRESKFHFASKQQPQDTQPQQQQSQLVFSPPALVDCHY
ncbi:hypothetical protein Droror1_Dr00016776 [Drosera rotundifolia]